jgi:hypothetical protein
MIVNSNNQQINIVASQHATPTPKSERFLIHVTS